MARPRAYNLDIRCQERLQPDAPKRRLPRPPGLSLRRLRTLLHSRRRLHPPQRRRPRTGRSHARGRRFPKRRGATGGRNPAGGAPAGQKGALPRSPGCAAGADSAGKARPVGSWRW